eukprot:TRINITY_DN2852_c0_g1_i1.p1 TRINITY_DN2852_c0_g1~~TRINITY_DN2852_c0_g1_i1.p1  ORF type:complete len:291 (+),score=80.67 TRINITY_DN2852_c0_g1_i1:53-925(+)
MADDYTNHRHFRDYDRETTEQVLNSADRWTYLYRHSSVKGKVVLSVRAKDVAHVLINVNRAGKKQQQVYYAVHKSGAEQVKLSESTLFESLDDMIAEIENQLKKHFIGIDDYEEALKQQEAEMAAAEAAHALEEGGKLDEEAHQSLIASAGKVVMKAMLEGHNSMASALESEYRGMLRTAFMTGQASQNFLMELSRWREFNHFTKEMHDKVLAEMGKTEDDWDKLKQWGDAGGAAASEAHLCVVCLTENKDALFPACGHICTCISCAASLRDCPLCRKEFGKNKPIKVFM